MEKQTRTIAIELGERKAGAPKTFSATISTEAAVRRKDWERGEFDEVLSHAKGAIDLGRSPLPLIESHNSRALPIGVVDNLRIVDKKLKGDVRFGASARATEVAADVEAGIIRNLSVGYEINAVTETKSGDKTTTVTATRWTPHEVSAVAIGADAGAGFNRGYPTMENENENEATPATEQATRARDSVEIARICRNLNVGDELADDLISRGLSVDEARKQIINEYSRQRQSDPVNQINHGHRNGFNDGGHQIRGGVPAVDDFRAAAVDAVLLRAGVRIANPHAAARDVNASVADLARVCVSRAGVTVSGGQDRLIKRAMSTSDFPLILADAMHKATRMGYEDEPASHRAWVRSVPVADFKDQNRPILGSAPDLAAVEEGGEYTYGALSEDSASYRVSKYGKIVSLTWEALKNDDLSAFLRIKPAMGQAARRKEADVIYALLAENAGAGPQMQDGTNLFDLAGHGNVTASGAVDAATLGLARALLRKQTALGGGFMSLVPRYMIVPSEHETDAEILLASATKHIATGTESDTPKWLSNLELVVEPRLADDAFYIAADSSQIDTVELGLLDDNAGGPTIEEEQDFGVDQYRWKVRHVFGAKALDWRGIVKAPIS